MASVTAVGSAALDTITTSFGRADDILGGSVFFIGAAGSLFAPVNIVAVVGDDFPMQEIEFLKEKGVNLEGLEIAEGPTFRWEGAYHQDMNRRDTIMTDLGVFEGFDPELPENAARAEYLLLANIDPNLQLRVLEQAKAARLVAFDTMNLWIDMNREQVEDMLSKVDLVFMNDEELQLLTGEHSPLAGGAKVLDYGPKYIVIKKGEHGSILMGRDGDPFLCPAFPVIHPKDPTGAGDAFAGAMLGYLAATDDLGELSLRRSVVFGTVAASFVVEDFGIARLARVTQPELQERFRKYQRMIEF